jgi:hypothetical protein
MKTTIAVKDSTVQILARLREKMKAKSIDETIIRIVNETGKIQKSRFGSQKGLRKFSREDRAKFHEL